MFQEFESLSQIAFLKGGGALEIPASSKVRLGILMPEACIVAYDGMSI